MRGLRRRWVLIAIAVPLIAALVALVALRAGPMRFSAERWAAYGTSRLDRWRAFAGKALFRLIVPRNRLLAGRLPWSARRAPRQGCMRHPLRRKALDRLPLPLRPSGRSSTSIA